jgi:RHH-type proline utilization regulon transcriptional repressor/proline dehydrogenase/delta 1-pyrroline-5-carboxylate dehydrogenase
MRTALAKHNIASDAPRELLQQYAIALVKRDGDLLPMINETVPERFILERHLCVDTSAAGDNASLIATIED